MVPTHSSLWELVHRGQSCDPHRAHSESQQPLGSGGQHGTPPWSPSPFLDLWCHTTGLDLTQWQKDPEEAHQGTVIADCPHQGCCGLWGATGLVMPTQHKPEPEHHAPNTIGRERGIMRSQNSSD